GRDRSEADMPRASGACRSGENDPLRSLAGQICCAAQLLFNDVVGWLPRQGTLMRRREFIALIGGAAAGSPVVGWAQQQKLRTIGFLGSASRSAWSEWVAAFVQRLHELGWIEGRTV